MKRNEAVTRRPWGTVGILCTVLGCGVACGKSGEVEVNTGGPGDEAAATSTAPPPPAESSAPAPSASSEAVPGANVLENIISGALAGSAAMMGGDTGGLLGPVSEGIKMKASTDAKGMAAEGPLMSASLAPGGRAEGVVTLQPGVCYSIVGFGGFGIFDYQINLLSVPPAPPQVVAQSGAAGPAPTLGPNDSCFRSPWPIPTQFKVDMHAVRGQGMVGAQLYKK